MWMLPYAYKKEKSPHYNDLMKVAKIATKAIKSVRQTNYTYGICRDLMYPANGVGVDWAHEKMGIKYAYILELNPEYKFEGGYTQFLLPVHEIKPTLEETWAGILGMTEAIKNVEGMNSIASKPYHSVPILMSVILSGVVAVINNYD